MFTCNRSGAVNTISGSLPLNQEHREKFTDAVADCFGNGQPRIVVDFSSIPLIDSNGLEALLDVRDKCHRLGGGLVLARPNALCRDILRINGIDKEINLYDSTVKAMGSFAR